MHAGDDQARDMGNVRDERGADRGGNLRETCKVPRPRVRGAAAKDHLWPRFARERLDAIEVNAMSLGIDVVLHGLVVDSREIHVPAVGQVTAERQTQSHYGLARLHEREIYGLIRR